METRSYLDTLVKHYEECYEKHGDTCKGVDWPNEADAEMRHGVMKDVGLFSLNSNFDILDYGCGLGHFKKWLNENVFYEHRYTGYDPSSKMIDVCRKKFPGDSFTDSFGLTSLRNYDYVIMNGLFTVKRSLSFEQAWQLMTETLLKVWPLAKVGIAFNAMSCNVTHERSDLFHCPLDRLTRWICDNLSRNFVVRSDYGLHENTIYVYK